MLWLYFQIRLNQAPMRVRFGFQWTRRWRPWRWLSVGSDPVQSSSIGSVSLSLQSWSSFCRVVAQLCSRFSSGSWFGSARQPRVRLGLGFSQHTPTLSQTTVSRFD
ncbi:hypothetical protein Hdeb2414_s0023g00632941 [Helianthus debilis subsp. tardiflorus]